jgi:hypothetical protein
MLPELGKKDVATLEEFLDRHAATMPCTMLPYAIENMSPEKRQSYMRRDGAATLASTLAHKRTPRRRA